MFYYNSRMLFCLFFNFKSCLDLNNHGNIRQFRVSMKNNFFQILLRLIMFYEFRLYNKYAIEKKNQGIKLDKKILCHTFPFLNQFLKSCFCSRLKIYTLDSRFKKKNYLASLNSTLFPWSQKKMSKKWLFVDQLDCGDVNKCSYNRQNPFRTQWNWIETLWFQISRQTIWRIILTIICSCLFSNVNRSTLSGIYLVGTYIKLTLTFILQIQL